MRYYQFQAYISLENWEEARKELDTTLKVFDFFIYIFVYFNC